MSTSSQFQTEQTEAGPNDGAPRESLLPTPVTPARLILPLLFSLLSGLLLYLCHFPVAFGWLGWVALVPLLTLVRSQVSNRRALLSAWCAGLIFFFAVLQWMRLADDRMYVTWAMLAVYCSVYFPAAIVLIRALDRHTPLPLLVTVPVVWTALEYVRAHLMTGFPWYFLAHTQHESLTVIQISDLAGAYGVSFLVAGVNALIFEMLDARPGFRRLFSLRELSEPVSSRTLKRHAALVCGLLISTLAYGLWRLHQGEFAEGPRVALIQGNLDQRIRIAASEADGDREIDQMIAHYEALCDQAAAQQPPPDLIVWPETSYPYSWEEVAADASPEGVPSDWKDRHADVRTWARKEVADRWRLPLLLGMNSKILSADGRVNKYNSAILVRPDGTPGGRYDKIHRVPFGEYVPLVETLPWIKKLAPYDSDYSIRSGENFTRFDLGSFRFGVVICFEDSDPVLARQYVAAAAGPAVDFLVNISNDGWFIGSAEHEEHLAVSRFRAVECRRAVARSVNMGISAVIDGNGRVVALPGPDWAGSKKIAAVLTAVIPIDRRSSLYAAWGDWFPMLCGMVAGGGVCWSMARKLRTRRAKQ